jgi:dTDP-4-dehydrorhamnose 3,5-epimerase
VKVTVLDIPGALLIEPALFRDHRGLFCETFHAQRYAEAGLAGSFVGRCAGFTTRNRMPKAN